MDRFDAMRAYVQVLDSGSFTKAAQALALHKATVSQQVQALEDRLGVRLLTRTTRSVAPTAEGLAYYQRACAILQQVDEAESWLRQGRHAASGHLRVEVPVAIGRLVLVPEIRGFLERHPRISLELGCTDRTVDLVREGVDCALRGGDLPDSRLVGRRVGAVPFVLCAALCRRARPARAPRGAGGPPAHRLPGAVHRRSARSAAHRRRAHAGPCRAQPARHHRQRRPAQRRAGRPGDHPDRRVRGRAPPRQRRADPRPARLALPVAAAAVRRPELAQRTARVQAFMDWAQGVLARRLAPGSPAGASA